MSNGKQCTGFSQRQAIKDLHAENEGLRIELGERDVEVNALQDARKIAIEFAGFFEPHYQAIGKSSLSVVSEYDPMYSHYRDHIRQRGDDA